MNIAPIVSGADYERALDRVAALMDARPDTPEGDELNAVARVVEAWEERRFPIEPSDRDSASE